MGKEKKPLQKAQEESQKQLNAVNVKIDVLGAHSGHLYEALKRIERLFDTIRNVPSEDQLKYEEVKKASIKWKQQAQKIEKDCQETMKKEKSGAAIGTGIGIGVATFGPTAAMGVATTFGVASTGTAISALSGAAATNAALAWLGGGALAAGGGGVAAGQAILALAGPLGWAIAGAALVTSGIFFWITKSNNARLENIYTLIAKRDAKAFKLAAIEIDERIKRIAPETEALNEAANEISSFGTDFDAMTEEQQYALGAYVNLMVASKQLLVNPIMGLMPKYSEQDLNRYTQTHKIFISDKSEEFNRLLANGKFSIEKHILDTEGFFREKKKRSLLISLANLLWKIELEGKDRKILANSLKKNEVFLKSADVPEESITEELLWKVYRILQFKYKESRRKVKPNTE
jgi:hypothetical protein